MISIELLVPLCQQITDKESIEIVSIRDLIIIFRVYRWSTWRYRTITKITHQNKFCTEVCESTLAPLFLLCSFFLLIAAAAASLQSCPTLCDPIDGSLPGSSVPGILQARIQEWVATSISNAWKWKVKVKSLSCVWPLATPWTVAYQGSPSMGFSRQEYWSGVPWPSPFFLFFYIFFYFIF